MVKRARQITKKLPDISGPPTAGAHHHLPPIQEANREGDAESGSSGASARLPPAKDVDQRQPGDEAANVRPHRHAGRLLRGRAQ